jgi:C4-dicarboxylate transporter DctQ subunit
MVLKLLDRLEEVLIMSLMAAATFVIFVAVIHRYGSTLPVPAIQNLLIPINMSWAQEVCIYMFVWMAKFGAAYGVRTGIHVGIDVLINRMNPKTRGKFIVFGLACGALFTFLVGSFGTRFVWHMAHTDQVSPDLEMPIWIAYLAVPCGSYLMCFRFVQVAVAFLRTGELPRHDHAHVDGLDEGEDAVGHALEVPGLHPAPASASPETGRDDR